MVREDMVRDDTISMMMTCWDSALVPWSAIPFAVKPGASSAWVMTAVVEGPGG